MYILATGFEENVEFLRTKCGIQCATMYFIGFIILFLPDNIWIFHNYYIGIASEVMMKYIPSMKKWIEYSEYKNNTRIFLMYTWSLTPVYFFLLINDKKSRYKLLKNARSIRFFVPRFAFTFVISLTFMYASWNYAFEDKDCTRMCINKSRFLQAIMLGLLSYLNSALFVINFWTISNLKIILKERMQ